MKLGVDLLENERIDDLGCYGLKLIQNKDGFCFGIDSVILSDFAKSIKPGSRVLDLGTGNGIIATLLCGKTKLKEIIGVEIQSEVCNLARKSIAYNHLEDKFSILEANIKDLDTQLPLASFNAIVTNPPYKKECTGIPNEAYTKFIARHEMACNLEDIIRVSSKLLEDKGEFYMVHRPERLVDILSLLRCYQLEPKVLRFVQGKVERRPKLVLIKAVRNAGVFLEVQSPLIIYQQNGEYTEEMKEIQRKKE